MKLKRFSRHISSVILLPLLINSSYSAEPLTFDSLEPETKLEYIQLIKEAKLCLRNKQPSEAINIINEAEKILKQNTTLLGVKSAAYTELKDLAKAIATQQKALELEPENVNILFNLGELHYVQHQWALANSYFTKIISTLEGDSTNPLYYLSELKVYISMKKQGLAEEAKVIEEKYDFTTDSPIYYFVNAVKFLENGESKKAHTWIDRAYRVYKNNVILNPWQDTLIEAGYFSEEGI